MSAETKKVLEMLAQGKITADEADKLLEKLSGPASGEVKPEGASSQSASSTTPNSSKPGFLRIVVDEPGHDQVNIRIPLAFARSGSRLLAVMPTRVREKLADHGIVGAIGALNSEDWSKALEEMNIDIDGGSGKKVKVFCE